MTDKVCGKGDFIFAAAGLTHGHIHSMCRRLVDAGGVLQWAWDENPKLLDRFMEQFPDCKRARNLEEILQDSSVQLVATADIPSKRTELGLRCHRAGKHFFSDKAPFTTLEQVEAARHSVKTTGLKWAVCYSERLEVEAALLAEQYIKEGRIGKVIQVLGLGPHRLRAETRDPYLFNRREYGGILCDIGSHQIEQFLTFSGAQSAQVIEAQVDNYNHPKYPQFQDFGDAKLAADNGATCYFRVDWFTPDGLGTWGDGRTFVLGTGGYIELRKYIDVARGPEGNNLFLVDSKGEHYINATGKTGHPYFGQLILDCLEGTDKAMDQEHAIRAGELAVLAQLKAEEGDAEA